MAAGKGAVARSTGTFVPASWHDHWPDKSIESAANAVAEINVASTAMRIKLEMAAPAEVLKAPGER